MASAFEGPQIRAVGLIAGGDLSAKQFYAVKLSAANTVVVCAAVTDKPYGILQNAPKSGEEAEVCVIGQTKISADALMAVNASIGTAVDGQLATYTVADTTKYIIGICQQGAGAADGMAVAFVNCASIRLLA